MALTRDFQQTVKVRAERDPEFRIGLFQEAIDAFLNDEIEVGKSLLRDYVNATVGFEALAVALNKNPKSLMRMLSARGNPRADNLFAVVAYLRSVSGVKFHLHHQDLSAA